MLARIEQDGRLEIGGFLETCSDNARWESEIGRFLEACRNRARWQNVIGVFPEAYRGEKDERLT